MKKSAEHGIMAFTADDVATCFDSGTLGRGRGYAQRGMVLSVKAGDGVIKGKVSGSSAQSYRQTIHIARPRAGCVSMAIAAVPWITTASMWWLFCCATWNWRRRPRRPPPWPLTACRRSSLPG